MVGTIIMLIETDYDMEDGNVHLFFKVMENKNENIKYILELVGG